MIEAIIDMTIISMSLNEMEVVKSRVILAFSRYVSEDVFESRPLLGTIWKRTPLN